MKTNALTASLSKKLKSGSPFRSRRLSYMEYYHASVGSYRHSVDVPRENTVILEGTGNISCERLQTAVNAAAEVNPGAHLKLLGNSVTARWSTQGQVPRVREVHSNWNGRSSKGSGFIYDTPLELRKGVSCEFIIARNETLGKTFIIFRNLHAVMDGMGCLHFLREVFRALNGQPLHGSNAHFADTDLIRAVKGERNTFADHNAACALITGPAQGEEIGDAWERISLEGPVPWLVTRMAGIIANHATGTSDRVTRIGIPINLRRHLPDIVSSMNYTSVVHIDLKPGEGFSQFQKRLHKLLKKNIDASYSTALSIARAIPLGTVDKIVHRHKDNFNVDRKKSTAILSDLGMHNAADFCCPDFTAEEMFAIPIAGVTFSIQSALDNKVNITLGMPKVYASNGRLTELVTLIHRKLLPEDSPED